MAALIRLGARVLLSLGIGVAIAIAVAIWAANQPAGRPLWARTPATGAPVGAWDVTVTGYPFSTTTSLHRRADGATPGPSPGPMFELLTDDDTRALAARLIADVPGARGFRIQTAGWPRHCLAWHEWTVKPGQTAQTLDGRRLLTWRPPIYGKSIVIPTRPLWRNLAADAALFGAPFVLIFLSIPPVRALLRHRRGRCPRCAYDIGGNLAAGCPECGWNRHERPEPPRAP